MDLNAPMQVSLVVNLALARCLPSETWEQNGNGTAQQVGTEPALFYKRISLPLLTKEISPLYTYLRCWW